MSVKACHGRLVTPAGELPPDFDRYLLDCNVCKCIHQHPLAEVTKGTEEYYNTDKFYETFSPKDWFYKVRDEHANGYWNPAYEYQLSILKGKRYLGNSALLDVGCGAGWFMKFWYENTITPRSVLGIEPSASARRIADDRIRKFIFPSLEEMPMSLWGWNVRMSLVLEHIPYPVDFLMKYIPLLGSGGKLMIIVPNDFSPLQKRLGTNHFLSPVHLNYFTMDSLRNTVLEACKQVGYKRGVSIQEDATFPMELFQLMGIKYIGNDKLGRKCHIFRLKFERRFGKRAFELYNLLHRRFGWGREIMLTAKVV